MKNLLGSAIVATVLSISFNSAALAAASGVTTLGELIEHNKAQAPSMLDFSESPTNLKAPTPAAAPTPRVQKVQPPPVVAQTLAPAPVAAAPARTYNYNVAKAAPVQQPPVQQYAQQQLPRVQLRPAGQRHVLRDGVMVDVDVMCVYIGEVRGDCMDQQAHTPYSVPALRRPPTWNASVVLLDAPRFPPFGGYYDDRRPHIRRHIDAPDMRMREDFRGHSGLRVQHGWHNRHVW